MKCPYQTITIHEPEAFGRLAKEYIVFGSCIGRECPFFYAVNNDVVIDERCKRAEKEYSKYGNTKQ